MGETSQSSLNSCNGVAGLFDKSELKTFFRKYLLFLGTLEIVIFLICWIYQLGLGKYDEFGPVDIAFPWRIYFLVSFLAPIGITFLLGVVVVAFNKYLCNVNTPAGGSDKESDNKQEAAPPKVQSLLITMSRVPFLISMLALGVGTLIIYKADSIFAFLGHVGEKSVHYILIFIGIILAIGTILGLVWMYLNYKLRRKDMDYQYKSEVVERLGLLILDDNSVIDHEGKLISQGQKTDKNVLLLPTRLKEDSSDPAASPQSRNAGFSNDRP